MIKMKVLRLPVRHLLVFTACTVLVNIIILMDFSKSDSVLQTSRTGLGRQIASIEEDIPDYSNSINFGHLEMLNYDLKETIDKYSTSMATLGEAFGQASSSNVAQSTTRSFGGKLEAVEIDIKCSGKPFLLLQVHSKPDNFQSREAIRLSWGSPENTINRGSWIKPDRIWKTVFLVGQTNNSQINQLVHREAQLYGDVIIGDFLDTFRHLSRKMLQGLKWSSENCPSNYIMKTDEDCFVNIIPLMLWLRDFHKVNGHQNAYIGKVQSNIPVERGQDSRYFVSMWDHPGTYYKPYISGGGYLFSGHLVQILIDASKDVTILPVEDVLFGLLMRQIGVRPQANSKFLPFVNCERAYETLFQRPMCHFKDPYIVHGLSNEQQIHMHYNVLLMNFVPTICLYLNSQKEHNHLSTICS